MHKGDSEHSLFTQVIDCYLFGAPMLNRYWIFVNNTQGNKHCRNYDLKKRQKSLKKNSEPPLYKMSAKLFRHQYDILQYIPRNMHTVFALLCFVVVIHWLIFPYPSGLLHWHCGNLTIVPVPAKQPWWIWINTSCESIMNDCITTTKQSTTKPCAYFLGCTVHGEKTSFGLCRKSNFCLNIPVIQLCWMIQIDQSMLADVPNTSNLVEVLWGEHWLSSGPDKGKKMIRQTLTQVC